MNPPDIVSQDARGWIARVLLPDGRECIMIYTKKGFARGGEYHKSHQHDLIIFGTLRWTWKDLLPPPHIGSPPETWSINKPYQQSTQLAGIENAGKWYAYQIHMAEAEEDTLYIEWLEGSFEKTFDPETRAIVEERMKSASTSGSS